MERFCVVCGKLLVRKPYESQVQFEKRTHCDRRCAAKTVRSYCTRGAIVHSPLRNGDPGRSLSREEIDELIAKGVVRV